MIKFFKSVWMMLTHNENGKPSSTKFWQGVGYVCATWIMVSLTLAGSMSAEYLLIYLGAVTAARSFQNYLVARGGGQPNKDQPPRED